jgi:hypothetical protein
MKMRDTLMPAPAPADPSGFPDADELAVLRAWYAGLPVREAVERYQPASLGNGRSARGVLGRIRRRQDYLNSRVGSPFFRKTSRSLAQVKLCPKLQGKLVLPRELPPRARFPGLFFGGRQKAFTQ